MRMASTLVRIGSLLLGTIMIAGQAQARDQAGQWPGGKQLAVVLTYDDALTSHLDIAIPALDAAGLKGTFFLIGNALSPEQRRRQKATSSGITRFATPVRRPTIRRRESSTRAKPTMSR
jgi:peptidoglycan/xylan/chitin deacetylase (PgdA/CDA1 family)